MVQAISQVQVVSAVRSPLAVRPRVSYPVGYIVEFCRNGTEKTLMYTRDQDLAETIANALRKTVCNSLVEIYTVKQYFESIGVTNGATVDDLGTLLVSYDTTPR